MSIDEIISSNTGLIWAQLKRLYLCNDPDAESIGYVALYNAAVTFDESKGFQFSTYATCCIYNALGSYIRHLKRKKQLDVVSYNNLINECEYLTVLVADVDVERDLINKELHKEVLTAVTELICAMPAGKKRSIIELWMDSDFKLTYTDISKITNVSQPYVSQVINAILFTLRKRLEDMYYD